MGERKMSCISDWADGLCVHACEEGRRLRRFGPKEEKNKKKRRRKG
jgi:hypothetical protein